MPGQGHSPNVDAYLANAAEFAQPILAHLRGLIHDNCPEVVEEIKWSIPHFEYKGELLCMLTAYSKHCSFTFWKSSIMSDPRLKENKSLKAPKRFLGKLTSLSDLPPDSELVALIHEAMSLNEQGIKLPPRAPGKPKEAVAMPKALLDALDANPAAKAVFDGKSEAFRKEYIVWIADAKADATRQRRLDDALTWIAEGKGRFWKYK